MKSGEKFTIAVIIGSIFFIAGSIAFHKHSPSPVISNINGNTLSYQQLSEIYEDMGIEGVTDELLSELEAYEQTLPEGVIWSKPASLLSTIGMGDYDDDWNWFPNNKTVYAFDIEVFNLPEMYTDFLAGVSFIGNGELNFTNIVEDLSNVNEEKGTGYRTISFDWNDERFTIQTKEMNDWFDLNFANQLNKIIIEHSTGKQLYFADDGYQFVIVFYRDTNWANDFTKRTGCLLSSKIK